MKLRNKKTGEIIDIFKGEITIHYDQGRKTIHFKHLEDLDDWEDYEESKEYWFISYDGDVDYDIDNGTDIDRGCKALGNYFETKEEAELALRKLKAWKRLKDSGFRFIDHTDCNYDGNITVWGKFDKELNEEDVNLLFGGER